VLNFLSLDCVNGDFSKFYEGRCLLGAENAVNGARDDLSFARIVISGDPEGCRQFVDEYTDLVLSKVWNLMKDHCRVSPKEIRCSLRILQRQRKSGGGYAENQCDECMDSYLWFFEFLKKKIRAYKGKNNCSIRTFVWSIVNSHSTYIEWPRWKYGRAY